MRSILSSIPWTLSAIALAFLGLANLLNPSSWGQTCFLFLGLSCLLLFTLKIMLYPKEFKQQLGQMPFASTVPTYSMAWLLASKFLIPYAPSISLYVWLAGIMLHLLFVWYFTKTFVTANWRENIQPGWFVTYVGIVIAIIPGKLLGMTLINPLLLLIGTCLAIFLMPFVLVRLKRQPLPQAIRPFIAITVAPLSLCTVAFNLLFPTFQLGIWCFFFMSQIIFWLVLPFILKELFAPFRPTLAALTFPVVITASACKLTSLNLSTPFFLKGITLIEIVLAMLIVLSVFYRFINTLKAT